MVHVVGKVGNNLINGALTLAVLGKLPLYIVKCVDFRGRTVGAVQFELFMKNRLATATLVGRSGATEGWLSFAQTACI